MLSYHPSVLRDLALSGKMCSGKDTVADQLVKYLGYTKLSFAMPIKIEVAARHGITLEELEANKGLYREELQQVGHGRRQANPNHWINKWHELRADIKGPVVNTDTRYLNEGEYHQQRGALLFKIWLPEAIRIERLRKLYGEDALRPELINHPSEAEVDLIRSKYFLSGISPIEEIPAKVLRILNRIAAGGQ